MKEFKIGDLVDLKINVKRGLSSNEYIIESFQEEEGRNKYFPNASFPKGTIITNKGVIEIKNAAHPEFTSDNYKIFHTPCLSVVDIMQLLGSKYEKKLFKLAKGKLKL